MLIRYDNEVLDIARRIAASGTATRSDVLKLISMNDHVPVVQKHSHRENMPSSNYLGKEAKAIIYSIANRLPKRIR